MITACPIQPWRDALTSLCAIASVIAGNHDLPLDHHDDWYNQNYQRWHGSSKQVCTCRFAVAESTRIDGSIP